LYLIGLLVWLDWCWWYHVLRKFL